MTLLKKEAAVLEYAIRTYETITERQTIIFRVISITAVGPDTFTIHLKCTDRAGADRGYHESTNFFVFDNGIADTSFKFSNHDPLWRAS